MWKITITNLNKTVNYKNKKIKNLKNVYLFKELKTHD